MIYRTLGIIAIFGLSILSGWGEDKTGFQELFPEGLIDGEGKAVSLDVLKGKAVGVYFSAHWCGPCRRFTPKLVDYRETHKDDFEVVFVSGDRSEKDQFKYMKTAGMKWPAVQFNSTATRSLNSSMTRSKPKKTFPGLLHFNPTMFGRSISRSTIPYETPMLVQWVL